MNLKVALQEDTSVSFQRLQDVSDQSQDGAVMALMQLHQRILIQAPITEPNAPRLPIRNKVPNMYFDPDSFQALQDSWTSQQPSEPPRVSTIASTESQKKVSSRFGFLKRPGISTEFQQQLEIADGPVSLKPEYQVFKDPKNRIQDGSLFRDIELETLPTEDTPVPDSIVSPVSTRSNLNIEPDNIEYNPWSRSEEPNLIHTHRASQSSDGSGRQLSLPSPLSNHRASEASSVYSQPYEPSPVSSHRSSQNTNTSRSFGPTPSSQVCNTISQAFDPSTNTQTSTSTISSTSNRTPPSFHPHSRRASTIIPEITIKRTSSAKAFLPGEENDYAGFCKGAWRLQIGDKKKALQERSRPGSMYNMNNFWKCTKCNFEGRMTKDAKGKKVYDRRIFTINGIYYRWEFLFKSHVHMKDTVRDPHASTFGCIFCCGEGRVTPIFGGIQSFMAHLQEHRLRPPNGEVMYRINCSFEEQPNPAEDFDIGLPLRITEVDEGVRGF